MKKLFQKIIILSVVLSSTVFVGCKKDDDEEPKKTTPTACNGGNFCMIYDGVQKSGTATFKTLTNGNKRIYWENGSTSNFEQVELDINGSGVGEYNIETSGNVGTAEFEFFSIANGVAEGISGKVIITKYDPSGSGVSGTFYANTDNGKTVSDGKFIDVK